MPDFAQMASPSYSTSWLTPELARSPALASAAVKSSNPAQAAPVLSMAKKVTASVDAITENAQANNDQTWYQDVIGNVLGNKITESVFSHLAFLNKPLQEVSNDYKFLHAAWVANPMGGLLATAAAAAGGVGGFMAGGIPGAMAGAELTTEGVRHILGNTPLYADAYKKSNDPNYNVSFGRDFANWASWKAEGWGRTADAAALRNTNVGIGKAVSGTADAVFDWNADPLMILGKASTLLKSGGYLVPAKGAVSLEMQAKYPLQRVIPGVQQFIMSHTAAAMSPEQIDAVYNGSTAFNTVTQNYRRALGDMADIIKKSPTADAAAGLIADRYTKLGADAAGRLGAMVDTAAKKSPQEVMDDIHGFMKNNLYFGELQGSLNGGMVLPSRTFLRANVGTKVADYINENGPAAAQRVYNTFTNYMPQSIDPIKHTLSGIEMRWDSPDSAKSLISMMRWSMGLDAAREMGGQYAAAVARGGEEGKSLAWDIKNQAVLEMLKAAGLPDSNELVMSAKEALQENSYHAVADRVYGVRPDGTPINNYVARDGSIGAGGLAPWQATDTFKLPSYDAVKMATHAAGGFFNTVGKIDDWAIRPLMRNFWKPMALLNMGFGMRVATAEALQMYSRYGISKTVASSLANAVATSGYKLLDGQEPHVLAALWPALGLSETRQSIADKMLHAAEADGKTADEVTQLRAKLDPSLDPMEGMPVWKAAKIYGVKYASRLVPKDYTDTAIRLILKHEGDTTVPAIAAGHVALGSDEYELGRTAHALMQQTKDAVRLRANGNYTVHAADSNRFEPVYASALRKWSTQRVAQNVADDASGLFAGIDKIDIGSAQYGSIREQIIMREEARLRQSAAGQYEPYKQDITGMSRGLSQDTRSFATDRADAILGLIMGRDGTVNKPVIDYLRSQYVRRAQGYIAPGGRTADAMALAGTKSKVGNPAIDIVRGMPISSRPLSVAGQDLEQYVGKNWLAKGIDAGFRALVDPVINHLSRDPLYTIHVTNELAPFRGLIDKGLLNADDALALAEDRAVRSMLPQIHNPAFRNQFSKMTETIMPFYFAQEQAYRRAFNAARDTGFAGPAFSHTLRMYQIAYNAISNPAWVTDDGSGTKYIHFPAGGAFGEAVVGALGKLGITNLAANLPMTVSGNLSSLATVVPEMQLPGMGPVLTIPATAISDLFPGAPEIVKAIGSGRGGDQGILQSIVPNSMLKSAWAALQVGNDSEKSTSNMMLGALAAAEFHGVLDNYNNASDAEKQMKIDQIRNNMRVALVFKMFLNMVSPLSPQVSITDPGKSGNGMRQEFLHELQTNGGDFAKAFMKFTDPKTGYGLGAVGYTVSKSQAGTPGANLPLTTKAMDWMHAHADIVQDPRTSDAAAFLVPQQSYDDPNKFAIYNQMLKEHLRTIRTPEQFWKQMNVAAGEVVMNPLIDQHKAILEQNKFSSYLTQQENDRWKSIVDRAKAAFPVWHSQYISGAGPDQAAHVLTQFRELFSRPSAPNDQQATEVKGLLSDYDAHVAQMTEATNVRSTMLGNLEKQKWSDYLDGLKTSNPELVPVINSVFAKLG